VLRHALKPSGFSLEQVRAAGGLARLPTVMMEYRKWEKGRLRADGRPGFDTPTGKFEIASTILEEHGYDPLPVYTEPKEGPLSRPDLARDFPLVLGSGSRVSTDFRSQFHNVPNLVKKQPEPRITLNSKDAQDRKIANGDLVEVVSPRGRVRFRAYVTENIMPGVVDASMGGGGPLGPQPWKDCNVNDLTDLQRYDPISGFPVFKALLCEVAKLADGESTDRVNVSAKPRSPITVQESVPSGGVQPRIYLDHNATAPPAPQVVKVVAEYTDRYFGNPSSIHASGEEARFVIESARRQLAQLLNCTARRIVFTSGGSEADNLAIKGIAFARRKLGNHIITTAIEHPAVLGPCNWLEGQGFRVTRLPVSKRGLVSRADLEAALTHDTILVSIMAANNETGALQAVADFAEVIHSFGALFHTDAVQAVGKIPVDVREWDVDLLSLSGHKFYGPKGIGALYVRQGVTLEPLIHGGKQEHGLRAGTENIPSIAGLGEAAELAVQRLPEMLLVRALRDRLEEGVMRIIPDAHINGPLEDRLPNTLNVTLPGMRGEAVVMAMDNLGVALSSGSACRAGLPDPSHALLAMGLSVEAAHCSLRLSLGLGNTEKEIDRTISLFEQMMRETAAGIRFAPCR